MTLNSCELFKAGGMHSMHIVGIFKMLPELSEKYKIGEASEGTGQTSEAFSAVRSQPRVVGNTGEDCAQRAQCHLYLAL